MKKGQPVSACDQLIADAEKLIWGQDPLTAEQRRVLTALVQMVRELREAFLGPVEPER